MAKVSAYTAHTGAVLATGDLFYVVDVSDGTSGSQYITVDELNIGLPRLGFNPATIGIAKVAGTAQWNWGDGFIYPETDDDVDLGKSAQQFKDLYIDGTAYLDAIDFNGTLISATAAELNVNAGVTGGTVTASKTLVVDANKDLTALRNLFVTNLDAGASGTAGTVDVFPSTAAKGKLQIAVTDQTGDTTVTLQIGAMATTRAITLADPGATANILTSTGIFGTQLARASAQFDATSGTTGTTLTNVTGMVLTVIPATYKYRVCLPGTATVNSGIKAAFKLTTTVLTSIEATGQAFTASAVVVQHTTTTTDQTAQIASTTAAIYTILEGSMVVGTGGTIQIQAAQNASHADTTSVYAGATFELTRIA